MTDLSTLRAKYKSLVASGLKELLSTHFIKTCIKKFSFEDYTFSIANLNDLDEVLDLNINSYSKHTGFFIVFGLNDVFKAWWKKVLQLIIAGGRCVIATDTKSNKIIATWCYDDMCDDYMDKIPWEGRLFSDHEMEIFETVSNHRTTQKRLKELTQDKYGRVFVGHFQAKDDTIKKPFLSFFLIILATKMLINYCGYKYWFAQWSHISNIRMAKSMGSNQSNICHQFDLSKYVFNDGTNISVYIDKLKETKNYDDKMINALKKNMKIQNIIFNKDNINAAMQIMAKQISYQSPKKSKL